MKKSVRTSRHGQMLDTLRRVSMSNWFLVILLGLLAAGLALQTSHPGSLVADALFRVVIVVGAIWGTAKARHMTQGSRRAGKAKPRGNRVGSTKLRWASNPRVVFIASALVAAATWLIVKMVV